MKATKIIVIIAVVISAVIWATSTIAGLHKDNRDLKTDLKNSEFQTQLWRAKNKRIVDVGDYKETALIDTVIRWRVREIIKNDTILVVDTSEILRYAKYVEFDTSQTFAWANQSITIRAAGKLFTNPDYRRRNYLSIRPTAWEFEEPNPEPVIQFANLKTKFGIGLLMTNEVYGAYFRIGPTRLGVTSKYRDLSMGAYVGYEALSF